VLRRDPQMADCRRGLKRGGPGTLGWRTPPCGGQPARARWRRAWTRASPRWSGRIRLGEPQRTTAKRHRFYGESPGRDRRDHHDAHHAAPRAGHRVHPRGSARTRVTLPGARVVSVAVAGPCGRADSLFGDTTGMARGPTRVRALVGGRSVRPIRRPAEPALPQQQPGENRAGQRAGRPGTRRGPTSNALGTAPWAALPVRDSGCDPATSQRRLVHMVEDHGRGDRHRPLDSMIRGRGRGGGHRRPRTALPVLRAAAPPGQFAP